MVNVLKVQILEKKSLENAKLQLLPSLIYELDDFYDQIALRSFLLCLLKI